MKVQLRKKNGEIKEVEFNSADEVIIFLQSNEAYKVSFDFLGERLALRPDGTFHIFYSKGVFPEV